MPKSKTNQEDLENLKELGPPVRGGSREERASLRSDVKRIRKMFPEYTDSVREAVVDSVKLKEEGVGRFNRKDRTVHSYDDSYFTRAHEFGHAGGLPHSGDDSSIMTEVRDTGKPYKDSRFRKLITQGYEPEAAEDAMVFNDLGGAKESLDSEIAAMQELGLSPKQIKQYIKNKNKGEEFTQVTDEPKPK